MATYYVRASGGSDGNSGLDFANAWATIQFAVNNVIANDVVIICSDGIHYLTSYTYITPLMGSTSYGEAVKLIGGNATGVIDGTKAILNGSGITSSYGLFRMEVQRNIHFVNLIVTGHSLGYGFYFGSTTNSSQILIDSCIIDSCDTGIYNAEASGTKGLVIVNSEILSNTNEGISGYCGDLHIIKTNIHHNGNNGIYCYNQDNQEMVVIGCLIYRNGTNGILGNRSIYRHTYINNVIALNGGDGIRYTYGYIHNVNLCNNVLYGNGGYGFISTVVTGNYLFAAVKNNCCYLNTSGPTNINGGVLPGDDNIYVDPEFASVTNWSENFKPINGSPLINSGFGFESV